MKLADIPAKFPIAFAADAGGSYIRPIPEASQIGIENGAASLFDGFPPLCATPLTAGGVPPFMQDMNGILNQITLWSQWQNAGASVIYDSGFSTSIGGYPKGAVLASATITGLFWTSTVDDNATDPDGGGSAGWVALSGGAASRTIIAAGPQNILTTDSNVFIAQTVPAAITLMLPASPVPQEVSIFDDLGDADTHNININGNGKTIDGLAIWPINQPFGAVTLIWRTGATAWRIKSTAP